MSRRVERLHAWLSLALSLSAFGCNTLVGTDEVTVDAPAEGTTSGVTGGASAVVPMTPLNCSYAPKEPGVGEGKQLPTTLTWKGYAPGSDEVGEVRAADFFDCNGSKGIHVVVYEMAKFFCGSCEEDAKTLEKRLAAWRAEGLNVQWVTTLVTAADGQSPPNVDGAKVWRDKHKLESVHVVADPGYQLLPPGKQGFGTPSFVIVDPRTQTVVAWREGLGGQDGIIEATAKKNADAP
jgi:hypothetical protein